MATDSVTRSHLIHRASVEIPSRFALVKATARCARLFHNPGQRIGESINTALRRIAEPGKPWTEVDAVDGMAVEVSSLRPAFSQSEEEVMAALHDDDYSEGPLYEVQH